MAIYVNDKVLEPKENGNSVERMYFEGRKKVLQMFEQFGMRGAEVPTIMLTRNFEKKWNNRKTSYKQAPPVSIPTVANVYDNELGSIEVRYASSPPIKNDKTLIWPRDKDISLMSDTAALTADKLDKAWFVLMASNIIEKGIFSIVDSRGTYTKQLDEMMLQKEIQDYLLDPAASTELIAKTAAIFFKPGEINYKFIDSESELAVRMIEKAFRDKDNKKEPGLQKLKAACLQAGFKKAPGKNTLVEDEMAMISFELDGEGVSTSLLKAPTDISYGDLIDEARSLGIEPHGKKKDVLYSMIQFVKTNNAVV